MKIRRTRSRNRAPGLTLAGASACLLLAGCETDRSVSPVPDPSVPSSAEADESELQFLSPAADAPELAQSSVSFYAVRGQDREASIWYHARPGASDSTRFLHFEVGEDALLRRPGGAPIAEGDSILITLTVTDPSRLLVDFQPTGLRFSREDPAELTFGYGEADPDYDDDGDVDDDDAETPSAFDIWRQEGAGDPFILVPSEVDEDDREVEAEIDGFTRYAVCY